MIVYTRKRADQPSFILFISIYITLIINRTSQPAHNQIAYDPEQRTFENVAPGHDYRWLAAIAKLKTARNTPINNIRNTAQYGSIKANQ